MSCRLFENHGCVAVVCSHDVLHGLLLASHTTASEEQVRLSLALLALVRGLAFTDTNRCCRKWYAWLLLLMADVVMLPLLLTMVDLGGLRREEVLLV